MNVEKLQSKMEGQGVCIGDLAQKIGISKSALYRKMQKSTPQSPFTVAEAQRIKEALSLSTDEAVAIFLS